MKNIHIKNHLWMHGGSVGVDSQIDDDVLVTIGTKTKSGAKLYPSKYFYPKNFLRLKPVKTFSRGIPVRIIPIREMEIR